MTDQAIHLSNNPPLVDVQAIALRYKDDFVASTLLLDAEANLPATITDPAGLELCTQHVKNARAISKKLDGHRDTEKTPFDNAGKAVQNLFKPRLDKLKATKDEAEKRIGRYQAKVADDARIAAAKAAEAERAEAARRAEAAASMEGMGLDDVAETVLQSAIDSEAMAKKLDRVSTGNISDLVRTQTETGTVSAQAKIDFEITDQTALRATLGLLGPHFNVAHIEQAIRGYRDAEKKIGRPASDMKIAGVTFTATSKAFIR